jgi:hypothetical protein
MHLYTGAQTAQLQASQFPGHRPMQPLELPQWVLAPSALGNLGVLVAEAHQHVLHNYLRQNAALHLQSVVDDIFLL